MTVLGRVAVAAAALVLVAASCGSDAPAPGAAAPDQAEFARVWQDRVRRILVEHRDRVVQVSAVPAA